MASSALGHRNGAAPRLQHSHWTQGRLEGAIASARHPERVREIIGRMRSAAKRERAERDLAQALSMAAHLRDELLPRYLPLGSDEDDDFQILSSWLGQNPDGWSPVATAKRLDIDRCTYWRVVNRFTGWASCELERAPLEASCTCQAGVCQPHTALRAINRQGFLKVELEQLEASHGRRSEAVQAAQAAFEDFSLRWPEHGA